MPRHGSFYRYWWLKRFAIAGLSALALLAATWCLWSWYANGVLERETARLRAAGHPVAREDLRTRRLADAENALIPLRQAGIELSRINVQVPSASATVVPFRNELPYPPAWHVMMDNAYPACAGIHSLLRQARAIRRTAWDSIGNPPPPLRDLAHVAADTALYHHFKGDDAAALDSIDDVLFLSDAESDGPFLVSKMVGVSIHNMAMHRLAIICTDLHVATAERSAAGGAATRHGVEQLIQTLLADDAIGRRFRDGIYGNGVFEVHMLDTYRSGLLRPFYAIGVARYLAVEDANAGAFLAANYLTARPRLVQPSGYAAKASFMDVSPRTVEVAFQERTCQRMVATSLAIALFRADHGRVPGRLEELIPRYLPAVPVDPMSAIGSPLGYVIAAGGKRPVLVSAGVDGILSMTDPTLIPASTNYDCTNASGSPYDDYYMDLSAWKIPSPRASSTDAQIDQNGQTDTPGDGEKPE